MLGLPMLKTGRASPLLSWLSHFLRDSVTDGFSVVTVMLNTSDWFH